MISRLAPTSRAALPLCAVVLLVMLGLFAPSAQAQPDDDERKLVVFIGVAGLSWDDISDATPAMQSLTQESVGSLIVRGTRPSSCPADGWLAISAGNRAGDLPGPCRRLTEPGTDGVVPGWQDYLDSAASLSYRARPGTLGQAMNDRGIAAVGIGPGAAIALADHAGQPAEHHTRRSAGVALTTQVITAARGTDLLVIDAGELRPIPRLHQIRDTDAREPLISPFHPGPFRAETLHLIDRRVASIIAGLGSEGTDPVIMLAGVSDDGRAALRVLAVTGADGEPGLGISPSTRQAGFIAATDLLPTLVSMVGAQPVTGDVIGAPVRFEPTGRDAAERRELLREQNEHAQSVRPITPPYYLVLVILNLSLFAAMAVGLKRPAAERVRRFLQRRAPALADRLTAFTVHRRKVLRGIRLVALSIAALPVASFLANGLPWWRHTPPALGLAAYIALFVAVIVMISLTGPWRRHVLGSMTVVAGITALVLTVDIATGARLQVDAVMGTSTLVAGRMYGMNNTAFTLFTVSTMLVTITIANYLVQRGRRGLAAGITAVIGLAVSVFDGAPNLGADFGGPPALLPAYAMLALLAAGVRLTVLRVLVVLVASAAAALSFAFVDWLRPDEDRTHLGRFFQTVLDGGLWDVVWRKLGQNLAILFGNTPLTLLALFGVLTVIFVFARPIRGAISEPGMPDSLSGGTPLGRMGQAAPMLPPGIACIGVALGIGMAVNDSGVAIPAVGVATGVPLLVAACSTWMLGLSRQHGHRKEPDDVTSAVNGDAAADEPTADSEPISDSAPTSAGGAAGREVRSEPPAPESAPENADDTLSRSGS